MIIARFLRGPLTAAIVLTCAWLLGQLFYIRLILQALLFVSAPAFVASIHCLSFIELRLPSVYANLLPHHVAVRAVVYFTGSLLWAAFLSLPFWSRFRIGSLSAIGTEIVIVVVAIIITFLAFAFMSLPAQS
jgi:hypothetical protein